MTQPRRLGVYGGTFDPVHFGHLRPALEIATALELDEVRLIPCHCPPHRGEPHASSAQRLAMLRLAVAEQPPFVVDARELERDGPSYTVDTLASLHADEPQATLLLFMGMDAFAGFPRWHRWEQVLEQAHLVITPRPGCILPAEAASLLAARRVDDGAALETQRAGRILVQPVTQLDISATRIRTLLASGGDVRFLLPLVVHDYLQQHGLYCPQPSQR